MISSLYFNSPQKTEKYTILPNGIIQIQAVIAHTGMLEYEDGDLYVDEDTLFEKGHMRALAGTYITIDHPNERVTPDNSLQYTVGYCMNPIIDKDNGRIISTLAIGDRRGIDAVLNGYLYVSEAYHCKKVLVKGIMTQRHRKTNHVALVKNPRAKNAKLLLDSQNHKINKEVELCCGDAKSFSGRVNKIYV